MACDYDEDVLDRVDHDDNTLAHLAAYKGDPELFKVQVSTALSLSCIVSTDTLYHVKTNILIFT